MGKIRLGKKIAKRPHHYRIATKVKRFVARIAAYFGLRSKS